MRLKYYEEIEEMPVYNWFKFNSTGDYSWLLIKKKKIDEKETVFLMGKWKILFDQYIEMFGFNESFLSLLEKRAKIARLIIKKYETGDNTINTLIKLKQADLDRQQQEEAVNPKTNFYDIKTYVEKQMGFQIDIRSMSVVEFQTTLNTVNKNG